MINIKKMSDYQRKKLMSSSKWKIMEKAVQMAASEFERQEQKDNKGREKE